MGFFVTFDVETWADRLLERLLGESAPGPEDEAARRG